MGATYAGKKVYISKSLLESLSEREKKVILAHEHYHIVNHDTLRLAMLYLFLWWLPPVVRHIRRKMEEAADVFALRVTGDRAAFVSLMDKLSHGGSTHPTKERRLQLAHETHLI